MEMLSRAEAEQRIRERAASDASYREQLIADPRKALAAELDVAIPQEITVHVHEETMSEVHLVLPPTTQDLSDADLEMVSGGGSWMDCPNDMGE